MRGSTPGEHHFQQLMKRVFPFLFIFIVGLATARSAAPKYVAGRLLEGWVRDLDSGNETRRLRAARTIGIFAEAAITPLTKMLSHEDASIRYWAGSHLGDIGKSATTFVMERVSIHEMKLALMAKDGRKVLYKEE